MPAGTFNIVVGSDGTVTSISNSKDGKAFCHRNGRSALVNIKFVFTLDIHDCSAAVETIDAAGMLAGLALMKENYISANMHSLPPPHTHTPFQSLRSSMDMYIWIRWAKVLVLF
jgi:hypothetical protein